MKMRPGEQTGFLLCGKEWNEGEAIDVRSPWDQGLVGRVTVATGSTTVDCESNVIRSCSLVPRQGLPNFFHGPQIESATANRAALGAHPVQPDEKR